jgi:hypothetical protein
MSRIEISVTFRLFDSAKVRSNSGVYFYKIEAVSTDGNEFVDIKKMMFMK